MDLFKFTCTLVLAVLVLTIGFGRSSVTAQSDSSGVSNQANNREDDTNLDTQLYLIVATNQELPNEKLPAALDPILKQLRGSLPFKNYRLTATLINRVKNNSPLTLKWIGGPLLGSGAATTQTPSFNDFRVNKVRLIKDAGGKTIVRMEGFGFGARIPIQSGTAVAANGPAAPIINYESTGLNTEFSMQEGVPVIVGTLNVGPSGDAIILVMSAKRTNH